MPAAQTKAPAVKTNGSTKTNGVAKTNVDKDQPISKKLGLKTGQTMVLIDAPASFQEELKLPKGIDLHTAARRGVEFDVGILFVPTNRMLSARLGPLSKSMKANGKLWIAYPKKGSSMSTDLNDAEVRKIGGAIGLVDDKVCAIDKTWSGLQFLVPDRAGK